MHKSAVLSSLGNPILQGRVVPTDRCRALMLQLLIGRMRVCCFLFKNVLILYLDLIVLEGAFFKELLKLLDLFLAAEELY